MMGGAGNDELDCWFDGATLAGGPGNDLIYSAWNATGLTILFAEGDGLDVAHIRHQSRSYQKYSHRRLGRWIYDQR